MAVLLINYDLNKEKSSTDRNNLLADIRATYPDHKRLSESSYAVSTQSEPKAVYERLSKYLDSNDYLVVLTLDRAWWGLLPQDVSAWLKSHL